MTRTYNSLETSSPELPPPEALYRLEIHPPSEDNCTIMVLSEKHPQLHVELLSTASASSNLVLSYLRVAGEVSPHTLVRWLGTGPRVQSVMVTSRSKGLVLLAVSCKISPFHQTLTNLTECLRCTFIVDHGRLVRFFPGTKASVAALFETARQTGARLSLRAVDREFPPRPQSLRRAKEDETWRAAMSLTHGEFAQLITVKGIAAFLGCDEVTAAQHALALQEHMLALPSHPYLDA